jgi:hypothetical protein
MAAKENRAAWLLAKGTPLEVGPAAMPTPGEGELVIEVYVAPARLCYDPTIKGFLPS